MQRDISVAYRQQIQSVAQNSFMNAVNLQFSPNTFKSLDLDSILMAPIPVDTYNTELITVF